MLTYIALINRLPMVSFFTDKIAFCVSLRFLLKLLSIITMVAHFKVGTFVAWQLYVKL